MIKLIRFLIGIAVLIMFYSIVQGGPVAEYFGIEPLNQSFDESEYEDYDYYDDDEDDIDHEDKGFNL